MSNIAVVGVKDQQQKLFDNSQFVFDLRHWQRFPFSDTWLQIDTGDWPNGQFSS